MTWPTVLVLWPYCDCYVMFPTSADGAVSDLCGRQALIATGRWRGPADGSPDVQRWAGWDRDGGWADCHALARPDG